MTKKDKTEKKKERMIRLSVRVSPNAVEDISRLQTGLGESLSSVLRDVIDEGLKAKKKELSAKG